MCYTLAHLLAIVIRSALIFYLGDCAAQGRVSPIVISLYLSLNVLQIVFLFFFLDRAEDFSILIPALGDFYVLFWLFVNYGEQYVPVMSWEKQQEVLKNWAKKQHERELRNAQQHEIPFDINMELASPEIQKNQKYAKDDF